MIKFNSVSMLSLVAAIGTFTAMPVAAAEPVAPAAQLAGQKIDSGLGDLPHYRHWADATGRKLLPSSVVHVAGEKKDSGLGDLPHYRHWADKASGRASVQVSQAK